MIYGLCLVLVMLAVALAPQPLFTVSALIGLILFWGMTYLVGILLMLPLVISCMMALLVWLAVAPNSDPEH